RKISILIFISRTFPLLPPFCFPFIIFLPSLYALTLHPEVFEFNVVRLKSCFVARLAISIFSVKTVTHSVGRNSRQENFKFYLKSVCSLKVIGAVFLPLPTRK